ncbi:hypothetical protein LZ554_004782 [Drepanopeziza brunnea f. sp. 'monogermtubi']|nr:hypothetical protein LZ554_004782 [Drepanopeziza brunnea f. sp. 'monogermtubi']
MPTLQVGPDSDPELQEIADIMGKSRKVVVVTGAGISTNCGIPDFRSENGLYSLIQAQYDAAIKNPPWKQSNIFDIDDRPKKKRKQWYYEVVAPDGKVVDVIDEDLAPQEPQPPTDPEPQSQRPWTPKRSSRSPSSNNTISASRGSTQSAKSSSESSLSSCSSRTPELPDFSGDFAQSKQNAAIASSSPSRPPRLATFDLGADPPTTSKSSSPPPSRGKSSQSRHSLSQNNRSLPNLKGRDLFDCMVWQDAFTTSIFYMFVSSLRQKVQNVPETSVSHKFLRTLRDGGRLVRNYSQNIDMLEEREGLSTDLRSGPGSRARFRPLSGVSRAGSGGCESVSLHGSLRSLRCAVCNTHSDWDTEGRLAATLAGSAPDCPACTSYSAKRTGTGRRGTAVGRLRPDIVLYGEEHPHSNLIGPLVTHDMSLQPDVLLIMGTSLRVHGLKVMVKEFAKVVHARGGKVVFVNRTKLSESTWGDVIDYWVEWDCDAWVSDLKSRREDIWLPQGAPADRRGSLAGTTVPRKRPQCKRDDKSNGTFFTFKILDQLGDLMDDQGRPAERLKYWGVPQRVTAKGSRNKPAAKKIAAKAPVKQPTKRSPTKKNPTKSDKPEVGKGPTIVTKDVTATVATVATVATARNRLFTVAPSLKPAVPLEPREPLEAFSGNNPKLSSLKPFIFSSTANHFPNINDDWPLFKIDLVSHPPSGSTIPIHTPTVLEKEFETRTMVHSHHGTRAPRRDSIADTMVSSSRLSTADTIVVEDGDVAAEDMESPTFVDDEEPVSSPEMDRTKRLCSIGAIVSSPEEGVVWHDAQEDLDL